MHTIFIYIIEVLICSGVLTAIYSLLLERNTDFRFCRLYLLLSVVVSTVIPMLNIPVWSAEIIPATQQIVIGQIEAAMVGNASSSSINVGLIVAVIYGLGVAICASSVVVQLLNIYRISKKANKSRDGRVTIVRSEDKIASFSFFNTIYISSQTSAEDIETILAHERSHIAHNHSLERLVMEAIKALLWWNPFAWIASKRLTEAHEFEADSDVISSGYEAKIYVTTLLKHLFGYSPDIANGLHNSLTKKRLKMILKSNSSRYALLRKLAVVPVLAILISLFSFTEAQAVAKEAEQSVVSNPITVTDLNSFNMWIKTQIQYPEELKEQNLSDTVFAQFSVDATGEIKDVKIVKSQHKAFADQVLKVFAKAPKWEDKKAFNRTFMIPIVFATQQSNKDVANNNPNHIRVVAY